MRNEAEEMEEEEQERMRLPEGARPGRGVEGPVPGRTEAGGQGKAGREAGED